MSKTTPHCACRNLHQTTYENTKSNSKVYSVLPNFNSKNETRCQSNKSLLNNENVHNHLSKNKQRYSNQMESEFKNYENIEYYTSGIFRPHSCPATENNGITDTSKSSNDHDLTLKNINIYMPQDINIKQIGKYQRKYSKSNFKTEQNNINNLKMEDEKFPLEKHYFDSKYLDYNSGLSLYMKNSHIPVLYNGTNEIRKHSNLTTDNSRNLLTNNMKKSSCGLKYIIFQKLSIMTHFITGSKSKKTSMISKHNNLSDENLFKVKSPRTKRSKSYHNIENSNKPITCNQCDNNCKSNSIKKYWKPRMSKVRLSNASNSSSGSIDAHAGSPITIMTTVCGNILSSGSKPVVSNTFCHSSKTKWENEEKPLDKVTDTKEIHSQRNHSQHRENINSSHMNRNGLGSNHNGIINGHSCNNCSCSIQQNCVSMPCDQMCGHQCYSQPYVQPHPGQPCHYCCCNHSHVLMHSSYSQSPYMCCSPSNFHHHCSISKPMCLHSFFPYNSSFGCNDICPQSILCNSCQAKNIDRCQSVNLTRCNKGLLNNCNFMKQSHNLCANVPKRQSKPDTKAGYQKWNFRHSMSNHSKSTSIPPPPPPPPSSLYSNKELINYKPKQKRNHSNKSCNNGKICTQCSEKMSVLNQESADNVQNIIYSHLNNSVACQSSENNDNNDNQNKSSHHVKSTTTTTCKNRLRHLSKNISWNQTSDNNIEISFSNFNNYHTKTDIPQTCSSKEQKTCFFDEENIDRSSDDPLQPRSSAASPTIGTHKPRFISKTPEAYQAKYDRRQKNHHHTESKRMLKHKRFYTTRQHNFINQDGFYRKDSADSLEASSFIYSPISPLTKKNSPAVAINSMSSFNIHQQHFNFKDKRNVNSEPARKAFQENMLSLREVGWYWGPLSFTEAERLMENKANGTFLVRDSGHDTYFLSLTFRVRETTYHTRIEYSQGTFSFWSQPESHSATTISEFIDKAVAHSQNGKFHYFLLTNVPGQPPMEVSLLYPLTRNQVVHSLKHLSRFVILSSIRKDHITNLNIPSPLKLYLLEKQYYISNFDQFIESTMDSHPLSYKPSTIIETLEK